MGKKFYTTDNDDLYSLLWIKHTQVRVYALLNPENFIILTFGWTILLCPVSKMQELETTVVLELSLLSSFSSYYREGTKYEFLLT